MDKVREEGVIRKMKNEKNSTQRGGIPLAVHLTREHLCIVVLRFYEGVPLRYRRQPNALPLATIWWAV